MPLSRTESSSRWSPSFIVATPGVVAVLFSSEKLVITGPNTPATPSTPSLSSNTDSVLALLD